VSLVTCVTEFGIGLETEGGIGEERPGTTGPLVFCPPPTVPASELKPFISPGDAKPLPAGYADA